MSARLSKSDRKIMFARELRKRERAVHQECFHFSGNIQSLPAAKTGCIDDWFTGLSLVVGLLFAGTFLLAVIMALSFLFLL